MSISPLYINRTTIISSIIEIQSGIRNSSIISCNINRTTIINSRTVSKYGIINNSIITIYINNRTIISSTEIEITTINISIITLNINRSTMSKVRNINSISCEVWIGNSGIYTFNRNSTSVKCSCTTICIWSSGNICISTIYINRTTIVCSWWECKAGIWYCWIFTFNINRTTGTDIFTFICTISHTIIKGWIIYNCSITININSTT